MSDTLKPCPFCGGEAGLGRSSEGLEVSNQWFNAQCLSPFSVCNASPVVDQKCEAEAIAAWNTRALDEASYRAGIEAAIIWFTSKDASTGDRMVDAHYAELADMLRALPTPSTLPQDDDNEEEDEDVDCLGCGGQC